MRSVATVRNRIIKALIRNGGMTTNELRTATHAHDGSLREARASLEREGKIHGVPRTGRGGGLKWHAALCLAEDQPEPEDQPAAPKRPKAPPPPRRRPVSFETLYRAEREKTVLELRRATWPDGGPTINIACLKTGSTWWLGGVTVRPNELRGLALALLAAADQG